MRMSALLVPVLAAVLPGQAAEAPRPAGELLAAARAAAGKDRAVLVAFHASWCSWCRRLEGVFEQPEVKAVLDRYFVIQWLTIKERGDKKILDNPGAAERYAQWTGGVPSGIPFYGVLGEGDALRTSSIRVLEPGQPAGNLGYPGSPAEIRIFLELIREGAPRMTQAEAAVLEKALLAAMPKPKA